MTDIRDDAETYEDTPPELGGPVDPPDERRTVYATIKSRQERQLQPIVPAWARNPNQRREVIRWALRYGSYVARHHAFKSPKYASKIAFWAPVGLVRLIGRQLAWWWLLEQHSLRQSSARIDDAQQWMQLHREAKVTRAWRGLCLLAELVGVAVAVVLLKLLAPAWVGWLVVALVVVGLAQLGRPAGKPITDRVSTGPKFVKLTAEQVREALCNISHARIKEPSQLSFPDPIHKDGPGWLARVNLPAGVEAVEVLERRGRLASALRLPIDQVWPEAGSAHAGQLELWVGREPSSKMGQPKWALAKDNARTSIFEPQPFSTDPRQRPITITLFEKNALIGGQPGSGKSYAARTWATIAALDPTCEMKIAEFKGTGDFLDMAPLCSTYACGVDDEALQTGRDIIAWALAECERRGKRIKQARERGEAPLGKVTPELAARPGSGLHPVFILLDEVHELFLAHSDAADDAERVAKRGRALGIILVLATQIADRDSVPPNITRCVSIRWCLSVGGQVENDMILGTGAYKRGLTGTVYRPGVDAGWGVITGLEKPGAARSFFPSPEVTKAIVARAAQLRGQAVVGDDIDSVPPRDLLEDIIVAFGQTDRAGLQWQQLLDLLARIAPDWYGTQSAESLSAWCRKLGIPSVDVKAIDGSVRKGVRRNEVERLAITDGR
jgi:S-DNA-T family DNA segregation ATPase FtsK/SpoIIIE